MLQVLGQAVSHARTAQADAAAGQGSIFDMLDVADGTASSAPVPEIPDGDFSKEQLLALEKETLGLYVSSHPLRDIRRQIRAEAETPISKLAELPDTTVTTVIGMVGTVKRITTKKSGETMAFVTLEGLEGSVEVLCFPAFYAENREVLVEDAVVKLRGRVDRKDEADTKLIPFEVAPFVAKTGFEPLQISFDGETVCAGGHRRPQGRARALPRGLPGGGGGQDGRRSLPAALRGAIQGRSANQPVRRAQVHSR